VTICSVHHQDVIIVCLSLAVDKIAAVGRNRCEHEPFGANKLNRGLYMCRL